MTYISLFAFYNFFKLSNTCSSISQYLLYLHLMICRHDIQFSLMIFILSVKVINDLGELGNLFAHFVM